MNRSKAQAAGVTAAVLELPDGFDPFAAFAALAGRRRAAFLDGGAGGGQLSILALEPFLWVEAADGVLRVQGGFPGPRGTCPFAWLKTHLDRFQRPTQPGLPAFQGGAIGYFGYELAGWLERLPPPSPKGLSLPDMAVGFYDTVAVFDHRLGKGWVISGAERAIGVLDDTERSALARHLAGQWFARLTAQSKPARPVVRRLAVPPGWRAELTPSAYHQAVERALAYIQAGDIYQVNVTQRFLCRLQPWATAWMAYAALRPRTQGPFSAYLDLGGGRALASGSPERFLSLRAGGRIEARPIKGTRRRGTTAAEDARLAAELLASPKDRAENLMIVDLLRNDLSRVAEPGSVIVPTLCQRETYATVHHLTSVIEGQLKPGLHATDLLRVSFPGGSITGAPKIRAMEIIAELEPARRGPYCGSVAWMGWDGAMDASIIIRSLAIAGRVAQAQAGGGIVADSNPADEYEESLVKIAPLLKALDPQWLDVRRERGGDDGMHLA
jgi:para-aminobenzoate synthetase component I